MEETQMKGMVGLINTDFNHVYYASNYNGNERKSSV